MSRGGSDRRRWEQEGVTSGAADEVRHWVLWGTGEPPSDAIRETVRAQAPRPDEAEEDPVRPGNDIARAMAAQRDDEWAEAHGWVLVVEADEDDVDALAADREEIRGYEPYLIEADAAGAKPEVMEERLHGDRVRRRPFGLGKRR